MNHEFSEDEGDAGETGDYRSGVRTEVVEGTDATLAEFGIKVRDAQAS